MLSRPLLRPGLGRIARARPPPRTLQPARWDSRDYNVAIIGSGPSGFYTAKNLFKAAKAADATHPISVDMFEQLPVPFGLVRFGVAPDHPEVKNVANDFTKVAEMPNFRFFGNVEIGTDVDIGTLKNNYDAVVVCTGAQGERVLGIPGEELTGVVGAPTFVKWYNGYPDVPVPVPDEVGEAAVVLGQGNVALDVARILVRSPKELHATDIDAKALAHIAGWQQRGLRTVQVVGRRGFIQAAFTNAELRELLNLDGVLPIIDPEELALSRNPASEQELSTSRLKKRSLSILEQMATNFAERESTSKRVVWLRFLLSPSAILPDEGGSRVSGIRLDRTALSGEAGKQVAAKAGAPSEDVPCGLVVRSVGFDLVPFPGVPFNDRRRVPHENGRVEAPGESHGGLYVSGWVKRGPQGIILSNIADAQETAARVVADLRAARKSGAGADPVAVEGLLGTAGKRVVSFADWRHLEAEELRRGAADGRTAAKLTSKGEMLGLLP